MATRTRRRYVTRRLYNLINFNDVCSTYHFDYFREVLVQVGDLKRMLIWIRRGIFDVRRVNLHGNKENYNFKFSVKQTKVDSSLSDDVSIARNLRFDPTQQLLSH